MAKKEKPASETISRNRKANFEYQILETYEAGLVLTGSEVKSLRQGKANIEAAYATVSDGEIWLFNANIAEYKQANKQNHLPTRPRKLLLHASEIRKLIGKIKEQGLTLAPLELFFNKRGIAKIRIGLAKGKKLHDKREAIKKRDWQRSKQRKDYD